MLDLFDGFRGKTARRFGGVEFALLGAVTLSDVRANVERRVQAGDLIAIRPDRPDATGRVFTTPEMLAAERDVIAQMQAEREKKGG